MGSKQALVDQVKAIQRSSPDAKEAWGYYCDTYLGGVRDPTRHDEGVLSAFLQQHQAGGIRPAGAIPGAWNGAYGAAAGAKAGGASAGAGGIAAFIKEGQRKSQKWREAWQKYCAVYGKNINDPARHSEPILVKFLDLVGRHAVGDLDVQGEQQGIDFERKGIKRAAALSEWEPPAKRGVAVPAETAGLVAQIKELQRGSQEMKEAWWKYCDESLAGARDPARHDAATLRAFLESTGI